MELTIGVLIGIILGLSIAYNLALAKKVKQIESILNPAALPIDKIEEQFTENGLAQDPEKIAKMKFGFKQNRLHSNGYEL